MRTLGLALAAAAVLIATQANAGSFPVNNLAAASGDLVDRVAMRVYVHEGHRYCFYLNGWHGPGWYRCGFAFRRGLGWGGVYGWNGWNYGPYERRYGGRHHGERVGADTRTRIRTTTGVETRSRSATNGEIRSRSKTTGSGVENGARVRGSTTGVETRSRSTTNGEIRSRSTTTGSGVESGARVRGTTTGSAPKGDVQSGGAAKGQVGPAGEGSGMRSGGGMLDQGGSKRQ